MTTPSSDGWAESTEGDLDPDLTDEAVYEEWLPSEPASRMPVILRVGAVLLLLAILGPVVLSLLR
ncbi:MAG: hypothetical protein Q8M79_12830 [Dehalococcoidia bacterium]|nr:hypothetical protein [Dehalococcoidia bacterium]